MDNFKIFNKWLHDYIGNVDISNIEWLKLNADELRSFFNNNYYDEKEGIYVIDADLNVPFGLYYLPFNYLDDKYDYLLGVTDNNVGKKTIVAAIVYLDNYFFFDDQIFPVTYISTVEVNSYFWNNGIYKRMCNEFVKIINPNQHVVISKESEMGEMCGVVRNMNNSLYNNGIFKECIVDEFYIDNSYFRNMICGNNIFLVKKKNL